MHVSLRNLNNLRLEKSIPLENLTLKSITPIHPCLVPIAISTWPKRNRAWAGRATGSGGSANEFVKFRRASNTLFPLPSIGWNSREQVDGKAFTPWKRNAAELQTCKTRGQAGNRKRSRPERSTRREEFFRRSACSTRPPRKLKFLFRLQIFVVYSPILFALSIERIDDGGGASSLFRIGRISFILLRANFLEFLSSRLVSVQIIEIGSWKFLRFWYKEIFIMQSKDSGF